MKQDRFKALKELENYKTFGSQIREGRDKCGFSKSRLSEVFAERKETVSEKDISKWEKDQRYPDITIIYMLAEILKLNPNSLLEAKQLMQEAGLNSIDMAMMRVVCKLLNKSLVFSYYFGKVMFWIILILILASSWKLQVPMIIIVIVAILAGIGTYYWLE